MFESPKLTTDPEVMSEGAKAIRKRRRHVRMAAASILRRENFGSLSVPFGVGR